VPAPTVQQISVYGLGIVSDFSDCADGGAEEEYIIIPAGRAETRYELWEGAAAGHRTISIAVEAGASLTYVIVQRLAGEACAAATRRISVAAGGTASVVEIQLGGAKFRSHTAMTLAGEGASTSVAGAFAGGQRQLFDIRHAAYHLAPHTTSRIAARGALSGSAHAIYRGLIDIDASAPDADGEERADTLLFSGAARIDAIPELQIRQNNVHCAHAVTASRISPETLFYLQSRGYADAAARHMILSGHLNGIVSAIPDSQLRESVERDIAGQL
jgi:Fe-S cluster assembly protein SufD